MCVCVYVCMCVCVCVCTGAIFDVSTQDIQTAFKYEVSSWSVQSKYQSGVKLQEMILNTHVDDSYSLGTASKFTPFPFI